MNTVSLKLPTDVCKNTTYFPMYTNLMHWVAIRKSDFATNVDINWSNSKIQQLLLEYLISYKSINAVCDASKAVNYLIEFLYSIRYINPGITSYHLQLITVARNFEEKCIAYDAYRCAIRVALTFVINKFVKNW